MVNKKTDTSKNVELNKNNELEQQLTEQLKVEQEKNVELENKINSLTSMVEQLIKQQTENTTQKQDNKSALDSYKEIDSHKRVLLMSMIDAGATLITHGGKSVRFDRCGQIAPAKFEDVESLRNKYRSIFENLGIRIIDDEDVVNALYLRPFYDKYKVTFEDLDNIINLEPQEMIKKIQALPKSLQESVLSMIVGGVARRESKYLDKNKWEVINNAFNINIEELSSTYFVE